MWIQTCENVFNYPLKYTVALLLYKYSWVFYTYTEEEAVFWGGGKEGSARKPEEVVPSALSAHHWTHLLTTLLDEDTPWVVFLLPTPFITAVKSHKTVTQI